MLRLPLRPPGPSRAEPVNPKIRVFGQTLIRQDRIPAIIRPAWGIQAGSKHFKIKLLEALELSLLVWMRGELNRKPPGKGSGQGDPVETFQGTQTKLTGTFNNI